MVQQQSGYGPSFDPYGKDAPFAAAYSHDFAGSPGLRTATSRRTSDSREPSFDGNSDCGGSSSSSIHVSIRIARSGGGSAATGGGAGAAAPKELELLKGVSGFAVPGKLMALMGGSGAGGC
jgi:hypothetical protein